MLFADAHCHSNPVSGIGATKIARKFKAKGGWFIALIGLPPYHYGIEPNSIDDYIKAYNIVISEAKKITREGLKNIVLVGFHPAEIDEHYRRGRSIKEIIDFGFKIIDTIAELYEKGLVDGIGEVGRQHYSTAPERFIASQVIMEYALEVAKDHGMIVHLHLEQGGYATVLSMKNLFKRLSMPPNKVFLHHIGKNEALWIDRYGLWGTIPGKYKTLKSVLEFKPKNILVESDFIDDPKRPGVSSYPWDIVENQLRLLNEGFIDEEYLFKINVDNIVKAYNVSPP